MDAHGPWTAMELAKIRKLQVNAARVSHFLDDIKTSEFSQVPSLSMGVHGTLTTLISLKVMN